MPDTVTITTHKYLPEGHEAPTTVREALIVGKAILEEDKARWIKGGLFGNPHPEIDPSTPFCNSWGVCAIGAVAVAVIGVQPMEDTTCSCKFCQGGWEVQDIRLDEPVAGLWRGSVNALDRATTQLHPNRGSIVSFNDGEAETVDQVLRIFDRAIENLS